VDPVIKGKISWRRVRSHNHTPERKEEGLGAKKNSKVTGETKKASYRLSILRREF